MKNATLVIGASLKLHRYSNKAIKRLRSYNVPVVALGIRPGVVEDVAIDTEKVDYKNVDTVTLYINPKRQEVYYQYILSLAPRRVIFNPGTENMELVTLLEKNNIIAKIACTLVLLSANQY